MDIKLFIGTVIDGNTSGTYVITVYHNGNYLKLPANKVVSRETKMTEHRLVLSAISDFLRINKQREIDITIHTRCEEVVFEWTHEYKEDGAFSRQTKDLDIWKNICDAISGSDIKLSFKGGESALTGIAFSKVKGKR